MTSTNTKPEPALVIVLTDFNGVETERIEIPAPPPMPLWRRFTWWCHGLRIDYRNWRFKRRGGR
jgi:hypothetical protein